MHPSGENEKRFIISFALTLVNEQNATRMKPRPYTLSKKKINKRGECLQYAKLIQGRIKPLLLGNYPSWPRAAICHLLSTLRSLSANACFVEQAKEALEKLSISELILLVASKFVKTCRPLFYCIFTGLRSRRTNSQCWEWKVQSGTWPWRMVARQMQSNRERERSTEKNGNGH